MKNKEVNKLEGHGTVVKNLPTNAQDARDTDSIPGPVRYLDQEVATCSSILAWRSPWTEESGWAPYNPWDCKESDRIVQAHMHRSGKLTNFM